jgi:hypothetical protein
MTEFEEKKYPLACEIFRYLIGTGCAIGGFSFLWKYVGFVAFESGTILAIIIIFYGAFFDTMFMDLLERKWWQWRK